MNQQQPAIDEAGDPMNQQQPAIDEAGDQFVPDDVAEYYDHLGAMAAEFAAGEDAAAAAIAATGVVLDASMDLNSHSTSEDSSSDSEMDIEDDDPIRAAIISTALAGAVAPLRWISNEVLEVPITIVRNQGTLQSSIDLIR